MTLAAALRQFRDWVTPVAGACALQEAEEALEWLLGCSRQDLYLASDRLLDAASMQTLASIVERRLAREPLAYILGRAYFHSRYFNVSPATLIPRPETEILVETVLRDATDDFSLVLDIGVGSGAILATLLEARPRWRGVGIDLSREALHIASINCPDSSLLVCADMLSAVSLRARFDIIVSNPPYVTQQEMLSLDAEIRDHEPRIALDGGEDGLRFHRMIAAAGGAILKKNGRLYCEIGALHKDAAIAIFAAAGWQKIEVIPDLAGRPRVITTIKG